MEQGRVLSSEVDEILSSAVNDGVIPGAVLLVSSQGEIVHERAYGEAQRVPEARPMRVDTVFDLASMTKILATTVTFMAMAEAGKLSIDDLVSKHIPEYVGGGREKVTLSDLLTHGSGLPAWKPFYREVLDAEKDGGPKAGTLEARRAIFEKALSVLPERPRGEKAVYSDVGFLILTEVIERVSGQRLDELAKELIFEPLGLRKLFFRPAGEGGAFGGLSADDYAAGEQCPWRNRILVGEVSDDNTHAMGGVAGHAGLFGSAHDVHRVALAMLEAYNGNTRGILASDTVREFWRRRLFLDGSLRSYGWDVPIPQGSQAGQYFSANSYGHLGFTGTSMWIDADRDVVVVLLTNRVHPTRSNDGIIQLRPQVHDAVMKAVLERPEHDHEKVEPVDIAANVVADKVGAPTTWHQPLDDKKDGSALKTLPQERIDHVWVKCKGCGATMYHEDMGQRFGVCPKCSYHHILRAKERVELLADAGTWVELDSHVAPMDPLEFVDSKPYKDRLAASQKKLNTKDALLAGRCELDGIPVHLAIFDFRFMGGSMGSVVGEKITRVFEHALEAKTPAIVISSSGGARMQEGVLSLMQMSKTCAALSKLQDAGLPYISLLSHPTTGGVAASFAMLGDVNIAEPGALIGFAGPRVIEQTIRQKLPEGFQRAEFLLEHGMVDMIVDRLEMKATIAKLFRLLMD